MKQELSEKLLDFNNLFAAFKRSERKIEFFLNIIFSFILDVCAFAVTDFMVLYVMFFMLDKAEEWFFLIMYPLLNAVYIVLNRGISIPKSILDAIALKSQSPEFKETPSQRIIREILIFFLVCFLEAMLMTVL